MTKVLDLSFFGTNIRYFYVTFSLCFHFHSKKWTTIFTLFELLRNYIALGSVWTETQVSQLRLKIKPTKLTWSKTFSLSTKSERKKSQHFISFRAKSKKNFSILRFFSRFRKSLFSYSYCLIFSVCFQFFR